MTRRHDPYLYIFQIHTLKRPYYEMNTCVVKKDEQIVILSLSCIHLNFFHFRKQINNFLIHQESLVFIFYLFRWKVVFLICLFFFVYEKRYKLDFYCSKNGSTFQRGLIVSTLLMNLDKNKNEFSPRIPS